VPNGPFPLNFSPAFCRHIQLQFITSACNSRPVTYQKIIQGYSLFPDTFHKISTLEWRKGF
jgi:hypothetical protein